jgi:hypothetical protein
MRHFCHNHGHDARAVPVPGTLTASLVLQGTHAVDSGSSGVSFLPPLIALAVASGGGLPWFIRGGTVRLRCAGRCGRGQ